MSPGFIVLVVLAVFFMTPLSRILIAAVFGKSIGKAALAKQPDRITLVQTDYSKLRHRALLQAVAADFQRAGFESAGLFSIPEMPGVSVQLLAHGNDSMEAAVYDHPVAGVFFDVISRYVDGSVTNYTTAQPSGLASRENVRTVNLPGTEAPALIERARRERLQHGMRSCSRSTVESNFIASYAEYMAWIKGRGISTSEVVNVAKQRKAA